MKRIRFSVRSLALFLTVVGLYLACWKATMQWGCRDHFSYFDPYTSTHYAVTGDMYSPLPFVVVIDDNHGVIMYGEKVMDSAARWYWLWFFGIKREMAFTDHSGQLGNPGKTYFHFP